MGNFDSAFVHQLATQSWSLYGVGMFLIILRIMARIHRFGIRGLQVDDYLMVTAGCWYTILVVCLNVIAGGGGSNLYPPEQFSTFTPEQIQERIHGSKIVIVSEQAMLNVIYTIKICMLLMYTRLTLHHSQQRLVRYLSIYVCVGWIATETAFFTACRPFKGYWAVPPPNPQCTTLEHYAIVQACFNISSDALMLFIPLPLITRLNVHWKQKIVLGVIFGLGIFVILAAILTKVFNLMDVWDPSYMLWYTRESSVAIYVSNLPMIWPLMREWFPFLRNLTPVAKASTSKGAMRNYGMGTGQGFATATAASSKSRKLDGITTTIRAKEESMDDLDEDGEMRMNELGVLGRYGQGSEERLRPQTGGEETSGNDEREFGKSGIHVGTTVEISEEHVTRNDRRAPGVRSLGLDLGEQSRDEEKGVHGFNWGRR